MFGGAYFGETYFGSSYWGPGEAFTGGGPITKSKRKLTQTEIDGLKAIYGVELDDVEYEVKEQVFETVDKVETVIDISALEATQIEFDRVLSLTREEKRELLTETDDIGLILAIIESLED